MPLWKECLSAQEVGENGKFVRRGGNFDWSMLSREGGHLSGVFVEMGQVESYKRT